MDSSSETVHLLISPSAPYLRLSTAGSSGSSEVPAPAPAPTPRPARPLKP